MMKVAILCVAALATASAFSPAAFVPKGSVAGFKPALRSGLNFSYCLMSIIVLISTCFAASPRLASRPLSLQAKEDFEISDGVKYDLNPFVLAASFNGWVIPTLLPSNIPLYGSKVSNDLGFGLAMHSVILSLQGVGLTQALYNEIAEHLATFPVGAMRLSFYKVHQIPLFLPANLCF